MKFSDVIILGVLVVIMVSCFVLAGFSLGYRAGQSDAMKGHWEYQVVTNMTVEHK